MPSQLRLSLIICSFRSCSSHCWPEAQSTNMPLGRVTSQPPNSSNWRKFTVSLGQKVDHWQGLGRQLRREEGSTGHIKLLYSFAKFGPACYRRGPEFRQWEKGASIFWHFLWSSLLLSVPHTNLGHLILVDLAVWEDTRTQERESHGQDGLHGAFLMERVLC